MEPKKTPSGFAPFLDSLPGPGAGDSGTEAEREKESVADRLLALLSGGPLTLVRLQEESGLPFPQFSRAVMAMLDADLLVLRGTPGQESFALTALGATALESKR